MTLATQTLRILGTRGVPAAHGGFETFAEHLALYLVQRGWRVVVYCQEGGRSPQFEDRWQGVERVHIAVPGDGPRSTMHFDALCIAHAGRHGDLCLTLGYNTALFCAWLRLKGIPNVINMDGIEWSRAKWGPVAKTWFWLNDWAGCWLGTHLVADHPAIKQHLSSRVRADKITTIAYGADALNDLPLDPVKQLGLEPGQYLTLVARPEPENSILEVVSGFNARTRGVQLAVLGTYNEANAYHRAVKAAAGPEVKFLGAIYDKAVVQALRWHSVAYVHGHQVGGTNPSLIEALGAGNAVLAHDNPFNRWVAGDQAAYFADASGFDTALSTLLADPDRLEAMAAGSRRRFEEAFTWPAILTQYEALLEQFLPARQVVRQPSK
jgi:glycosyltransferase involved in cell wall biosynthesis